MIDRQVGRYRFQPKFPAEYAHAERDAAGYIYCRIYHSKHKRGFIEVVDSRGFSYMYPVPTEPMEAI